MQSDPSFHYVDGRWLLALYAVIPLSFAVIAFDALVLQRALLHNLLPDDPNDWALWALLFGLPHIIASALTLSDRAYLRHYRRQLLPALLAFLLICLVGWYGPQPLSYQLLFVFFAGFTVLHVLSQQLGIALVLSGRRPGRLFRFWKWVAVAAGLAIYLNVYGGQYLGHFRVAGTDVYALLAGLAGALCVILLLLTWRLAGACEGRLGCWFIWANGALLVSALMINQLGYTLLVILMPRLIHDLTAFSVYITHDRNRQARTATGWLYRWLPAAGVTPFVVLPAASILIAWLLNTHQQHAVIGIAILLISFMHYYWEGFVWRGESPLRQHVRFRR
ncbi:MAG: hypothetical protein CMK81_05120 [Pseudomonadales bacterium]|nr:hypothetical protein [Pseudomonadales bacterium]MCK5532372.1 hypothetical protein [Halopseudomonas aestusnigri]